MSKVRPHISITRRGRSKNSADLDMGRRPELNTEEFSYLPLLVVEIISILCLKPPKMCYIVWEHDPVSSCFGSVSVPVLSWFGHWGAVGMVHAWCTLIWSLACNVTIYIG